jgi:hypothetical protein
VNLFGQLGCQPSCLLDAGICSGGTYCTDAGTCASGCQSAADCVGSGLGPICHQGTCVECLSPANCPDYNAGCTPPPFGGSAQCGICQNDQDCPGTHCEAVGGQGFNGNQCGCHSDTECQNLPQNDAPVCLGLSDAGFPKGSGLCACTDSSQCIQGFICEMRFPYTVTVNTPSGNYTGGACIPQCDLVGGTDCTTAGINPTPFAYPPTPPDSVCDSSTGYCVSCSGDVDCYGSPTAPAIAPSCVLYPNGIDPVSGEPTGGGVCGCTDTSQCNDNYACWNPGFGGSCQPACTIVNGQDSCNPYRAYGYDPPPTNPFCDTWTGACVQCLDSWGCTNVLVTQINGLYAYPGFAAPNCNANGNCVGCSSDADCPANAPNCTQGFCGFCTNNSNCFGDAGFTCVQTNGTQGAGTCIVTQCVGDANEIPTDAGYACPTGYPYCAQLEICSFSCSYQTACTKCRLDSAPPNFNYYNDCGHNLPPGKIGGFCESNTGTCYYY